MDAAQIALATIFASATGEIATVTPALQINSFTDEALRALLGDAYRASRALEAFAQNVLAIQALTAADRARWQEQAEAEE